MRHLDCFWELEVSLPGRGHIYLNEDSEDEAEEAYIPAPEEEIELEEHQDAPNVIVPVAPEANTTDPGEETDIVDSTSNTSGPRRTTAGQLPARLRDYEVQLWGN